MPRAKGNRTDLNGAPQLPITTSEDQQYGQATAQRNAMRSVPMGQPPMASLGVAPNGRPSGAPPQPGPPQPGAVQPGSLPFTGPTERPNEPIQTGLSTGPGAGPEIHGAPPRLLSDVLGQLSNDPRAGAGVFEAAAAARALGV